MKHRLLALALSLILLLALVGCAASSKSMDTAASDSLTVAEATETTATSDEGFNMTADAATPEEAPMAPEPEEGGGTEAAQSVADLTEKLIYTANVSVETTEFDQAVDAVEQLVSQYGGFLESSQINGDTSYESDGTVRVINRRAEYAVRVPSDQFQQALDQVGGIGNVTFSSTQVQNITAQFTDQEARKNSLLVQEERLLELLAKADSVDTLVALESRLSEVRYEIESIESTLRNWQNQVDYSTIYLSLQEVSVYTPTAPVQRSFGERLSSAFAGGWNGFVNAMKNLAVAVASALPVLILLAVFVVAIVLILRRNRRQRREEAKKLEEQPKDQP